MWGFLTWDYPSIIDYPLQQIGPKVISNSIHLQQLPTEMLPWGYSSAALIIDSDLGIFPKDTEGPLLKGTSSGKKKTGWASGFVQLKLGWGKTVIIKMVGVCFMRYGRLNTYDYTIILLVLGALCWEIEYIDFLFIALIYLNVVFWISIYSCSILSTKLAMWCQRHTLECRWKPCSLPVNEIQPWGLAWKPRLYDSMTPANPCNQHQISYLSEIASVPAANCCNSSCTCKWIAIYFGNSQPTFV